MARLSRGTATVAWLMLGAAFVLSGCASKKPPVLTALRDAPSRNPLVIVPGISGSRLVDTADGKVVWGRAGNFFGPRDGGRRLVLPVTPGEREQDTLRPAGPVLGFRLGFLKVDVYGGLIRMLEANGYTLGDLEDPRPEDSLFVFAYDWRRGNVESARRLSEALEGLKDARGETTMTVDLICQSNAARLARYFIKYDGASLDDAEAGRAGPPGRIRVDRLILVGTANGGALSALHDLHNGRRYVPLVGREFRPETIFTFPSMYEALPAYRDQHFFDEQGRTMDADLFDPGDWQRYGWSVYERKAAARLAKAEGRDPAFGDAAARAEFLAKSLSDARRLNSLLKRDVPNFGRTRYYEMQNLYLPTSERALIVKSKKHPEEWLTVFNDGRRVRKDDYLFQLASAPGDGHATRSSHEWLSPQERAARAGSSVSIPIAHRRIVLHPATHRLILEALAEPAP